MKCETCLNARPVISENGMHSVCCLSSGKATECMIGKKDHRTVIYMTKLNPCPCMEQEG